MGATKLSHPAPGSNKHHSTLIPAVTGTASEAPVAVCPRPWSCSVQPTTSNPLPPSCPIKGQQQPPLRPALSKAWQC